MGNTYTYTYIRCVLIHVYHRYNTHVTHFMKHILTFKFSICGVGSSINISDVMRLMPFSPNIFTRSSVT